MKNILFLAALLLFSALPAAPSRAQEEAATPIFSATVKSYDDFSEMVSTIVKAADPGAENPLADMDRLLAANPDAIDTKKPARAAVWLNGMFQPLIAVYVPTKDFAALKKLADGLPDGGDVDIEKLDGYALMISGAETSLEVNLAAARAVDAGALRSKHPIEMTVEFDDPTRTMLNGILAMGRLQVQQQSEDFGDEETAELMKSALAVYFDMMAGFVAGMDQTTLSLDIVDKGIRYGIRSTAKEGTTYAKLIAKTPMDPAPISENYRDGDALGISGRIGKMDDTLTKFFGEIMSMGAGVNGGVDEKTLEKSAALMDRMTPLYFSFGYDFDTELTAAGIYSLPEGKDVPAIYKEVVKLGAEMGKQMSGDGKTYSDFKFEHLTRAGVEVDRFTYKMGDEFPPNPIMGDMMEMEYAQRGNDIFFAMGGDGVPPLLERREPAAIPTFLTPSDTTVMIGHLDILSLIGTFATVEISHPAEPAAFIADKNDKPGKKKGERKNKPKGGSKILMRADLDGALNFDLHIPLSLIRALGRIQ